MTSRTSSSRKRPASTEAAVPAAAPFDDDLTEYERERLAKIAENKRILMELGEFSLFITFFRRSWQRRLPLSVGKKNSTSSNPFYLSTPNNNNNN